MDTLQGRYQAISLSLFLICRLIYLCFFGSVHFSLPFKFVLSLFCHIYPPIRLFLQHHYELSARIQLHTYQLYSLGRSFKFSGSSPISPSVKLTMFGLGHHFLTGGSRTLSCSRLCLRAFRSI